MLYRVFHFRDQESLDDPVRVPIIELAKPTAGHDERIGHVDHRVQFRVIADVICDKFKQIYTPFELC